MSLLVVVDIDGTISDATDRFRLAGPDPGLGNKEAYLSWVSTVNSNMQYDSPVLGMRDLIGALWYGGAHIVYLTSREEKHRVVTENWLYDNGFSDGPVFMREDESYSEVGEYKGSKIENLKQVFGCKQVVVIDDSLDMVSLCREKGYTLLRAMSGGTPL